MKRLIIALVTVIALAGCKTQYPVSTSTTVSVKDSTVLHIIDSVRYTERSRYKDYGDLLKVLEIEGKHSRMRSWVDSTKNVLNGELTEEPIEEHTKIVWRDREVLKDTTIYKEIPVEKEVVKEVKHIPSFFKFCLWWFIGSIFGVSLYLYLKFKTHISI